MAISAIRETVNTGKHWTLLTIAKVQDSKGFTDYARVKAKIRMA